MPSLGSSLSAAARQLNSPPKSDAATSAQTKPHTAPQRQSTGEIAREHGVKHSAIIAANPRLAHQSHLAPGDKIDIPQREDARAKRHLVERDETPTSIASRHGVTEHALREENGLEPYDSVQAEEVLNIPDADEPRDEHAARDARHYGSADRLEASANRRQADPVSTAAQQTDEAAARVEATKLPSPGLLKLLPPGERGEMTANASAAKHDLDVAVEAEIAARANAPGQPPLTVDTLYSIAAENVASRFEGTGSESAVSVAIEKIQAERAEKMAQQDAALSETGRINQSLAAAGAESDPAQALQTVNTLLASVPPDKQEQLLADPRVATIVDRAADKAREPLDTYVEEVKNGFPITDRGVTDYWVGQSTQTVIDMTNGLDPRLASMLVDKETQNIQSALDSIDVDTRSTGFSTDMEITSQNLTILAGRTFGAENSEAVIDDVINLVGADNWNLQASMNAIGERGAPPALAIRLGELRGNSDVMNVMVADQITVFSRGQVASDFESYIKTNEELSWLIANAGPAMSQEELEAAISDYIADHPGYEEKVAASQAQLANSGEQLTEQLVQLKTLTGSDYLNEEIVGNIQDIAAQPGSSAAIQIALQQNPALLTGERGLAVIDTFNATRDIWNAEGGTFIEGMAGQYITNSLQQSLATLKPHDLRTAAIMQQELKNLSDNRLASALGMNKAQLDGYLDELAEIMPGRDARPDRIRDDLRDFRSDLSKADLTLGAKGALSHVGQVLSVAGFLSTAGEFADEPTVINGIETILEGADALSSFPLGGKVGQLLRSPGMGAFIGGAQSIVGLVNAGIEAKNGDWIGGGITAVGAVGTGLIAAPAIASAAGATLAGSAYFGPIGFALVAVSVIGHAQWERIQESNKYMNETTAKFLDHSAFDTDVAWTLYDQSGEGYSTVPLIMAYGEAKGMSREETAEMINNMSPEQLVAFRDVLNHTLDEVNGDISKITESGPSDSVWTNPEDSDIKLDTLRPDDLTAVKDIRYDFDRLVTISPPTSIAEIDALLEVIKNNF
jgi:hypothetical protein